MLPGCDGKRISRRSPPDGAAGRTLRVDDATFWLLPEITPLPKYPWSTSKLSMSFSAGFVPLPGTLAISKWMSAP